MLNNFITTSYRLKKAGDNDCACAVMQLLESKIPLTFRFLSHSDDDVSATVMDFVKEYIQVTRQITCNAKPKSHLFYYSQVIKTKTGH